MKRRFILKSKPQSINSLYYGRVKSKTQTAREWSYQIFHQLNNEEDLQKFDDLRDFFKPLKHCVKVEMVHYFPYSKLFTKSGALSAQAQDITNIEKPLLDLLMLPKYYDIKPPYGLANFAIDDKYVNECLSKKEPIEGDDHYIEVIIRIEPLPHREYSIASLLSQDS